ncbi:hypothetical protein ANO11243_017760 [Dothideomycetidae sp. 11243]|nr:hypothetical protein ANO11243_017760 [fungal sp. No.11243]
MKHFSLFAIPILAGSSLSRSHPKQLVQSDTGRGHETAFDRRQLVPNTYTCSGQESILFGVDCWQECRQILTPEEITIEPYNTWTSPAENTCIITISNLQACTPAVMGKPQLYQAFEKFHSLDGYFLWEDLEMTLTSEFVIPYEYAEPCPSTSA